ncbi:phage major capsid protein [Paraburkholderia sp. Ac-20340]|uniref:phage major capsid protein n=1 Tax=Paraburkholderia sp. Ac-20340 TaxID=2703888 RepID=UPI00197D8F33|nr:phage major capsid protein [Paraburkholderia sp. Ac-20340]MBN3852807.1 phage major capsid protein [Paraburkholderia sp. Ac-20340]
MNLIKQFLAALDPVHSFVPRGIQCVRAEVDVKQMIEGVQNAFAQFKDANDKALAEVQAKGRESSDTKAKVETISADIDKMQSAIDKMAVQMAGSQMVGGKQLADKEYTEAFKMHMKRGDVSASLNKGADEQGGYLAPTEWDRTLTDKLILVSPMRQICRVEQTSRGSYSKLFNLRGTDSGWVGEAADRPQTNTATFKSLTYATGELYANPAATQQMLDDSFIDLESWLAAEVQTEFALQEGKAFLAGTGTNQPTGLLTYVTGATNAAVHPFGAIETVNSGDAATITADSIYDLIYALPTVFTGNARFAMNRNTMGVIRKLKDSYGQYLWQPAVTAGQPATLAGYSLTELPDMPDVAAGAVPVLFGDFAQTYLINDRVGVRVLRDPYTAKPYVSYYVTKRVGGGLLNPETMKALTVAAASA